MARSTRKCIVCGKEYEFCGGCKRKNKPSWMNLYHDENCKNIWHAITTFYDKDGAVAAAEMLSDLDLSDMDNFSEDVKNKIEMIFDEAFNEKDKISKENAELNNEESINKEEEVVYDDDFESFEEE